MTVSVFRGLGEVSLDKTATAEIDASGGSNVPINFATSFDLVSGGSVDLSSVIPTRCKPLRYLIVQPHTGDVEVRFGVSDIGVLVKEGAELRLESPGVLAITLASGGSDKVYVEAGL